MNSEQGLASEFVMGDFRSNIENADKQKQRKLIRRSRPFFVEDIEKASTASPRASCKFTGTSPSVSGAISRLSVKMPPVREKKERKRERWLLTRKTWKYMADAGRKLIPDGVPNRPEDLPKVERHFQQLCANEPRFILWRRKASYPGALRASRRRLKLAVSRSHKSIWADIMDENEEEARNADHVMEMLQSYLKIDESRKTTMLLGSKTVRPDQTSSPSAQRPTSSMGSSAAPSSSRGPGFLPSLPAPPKPQLDSAAQIQNLLDRLKALTQYSNSRTFIPLERITPDILEDKALLKQIYNELKKQQLHRILGRHSKPIPRSTTNNSLAHSTSLISLWHQRREVASPPQEEKPPEPEEKPPEVTKPARRKPPNTLALSPSPAQVKPVITVKRAPPTPRTFSTTGTQTAFVGYNELQRLSKEYQEKKREEAMYASGDDEAEKAAQPPTGPPRRKSSVDNEDVSQSVSDTIKRYLRMARKKSVHDDAANRFKRVNYDRNLRNIRAKGEINPPGMDEGNSKATQTLDAWAAISLEFIRGNENAAILDEAHSDWKKSLEQRIQNKLDFEEKLRQKHSSAPSSLPTSPTQAVSPTSSQTPTSAGPTGLLHSSTQFFSNLWHGAGHHQDPPPGISASNSTSSINSAPGPSKGRNREQAGDMQKSKSSSNVGQFIPKKIWKSRSKSQTRTDQTKAEWIPQGNCVWTSASGRRIVLADMSLFQLSDVERKTLHKVAIDKINQLNIGATVVAPAENGTAKAQKRRPLLIKRKALTTSFFDTGKGKDGKNVNGSGGGAKVFGVSLEQCLDNEQKAQVRPTAGTSGAADRGSRNSIISLLSGAGSSKGSDTIGSCESLPAHSATNNSGLVSPSSSQLSFSQTDIRRGSHDDDEQFAGLLLTEPPSKGVLVPALVTTCIAHLEEHGINQVGIFRLGTSKVRVMKLKEFFDRGEITSFDADVSVHDIATILKEYFRELPEPLLCTHLYKAFVKTQRIRNRRLQLEALSHLVQLLPIAHRDTLYDLLKFLAKVARHSDDVTSIDGTILKDGNRMDSANLATVFAPNILRTVASAQSSSEQINEQIDVINVIRTMIDHYEELFKVPAEIMDEIFTNMIDTFPQQLNYLCDRREALADDTENIVPMTPNPLYEDPKPAPAKLYSREEVMHENTAAKNNSDSSGARRRERTSKMKYAEADHELVRRRRRAVLSTPANDLLNQLDDANQDHSRSPYVFDNSGVVTASLKIPVQMPSNAEGQLDFSDIPYIEEAFGGMDIGSTVTGSLSLGANNRKQSTSSTAAAAASSANVFQIPIAYEGRLLNSPQGGNATDASPSFQDQAVQPIRPTRTGSTHRRSSKGLSLPATMRIGGIQPMTGVAPLEPDAPPEPKFTTSISNIGGAVMRSKTAEFERRSSNNSNMPSTPNRSSSSSVVPAPSPAEDRVYKRQELISSAKRGNASK